MLPTGTDRLAFYVGQGREAIFSWYHPPAATQSPTGCTVIICPPMGHEYTHSHRSLRALASTLAQAGFGVLRFDYNGTGDSPGDVLDANRVSTWKNNILQSVNLAREQLQSTSLCLLGLRLGATLACEISAAAKPEFMILWEPIVKGRRYARELSALANLGEAAKNDEKNYIESAGFLMSQETNSDIKGLDLTKTEMLVKNAALVLSRDTRASKQAADNPLEEVFRQHGIQTSYMAVAGYDDMMAEPQDTKVPSEAIDTIQMWLTQRIGKDIPQSTKSLDDGSRGNSILNASSIQFTNEEADPQPVRESIHWFSHEPELFGILSEPGGDHGQRRDVCVILSNSGSVHHVGPNSCYTKLARKLASNGISVLRIDLGGLGDSDLTDPDRINHPYQTHAVQNVETAIAYIKELGIAKSFVIAGLCSGAHTAFHTALQLNDPAIKSIIPINPLVFYWDDSFSLAIPTDNQRIRDKVYYRGAVRDLDKWKKLFSGKADTGYVIKHLISRVVGAIKNFEKQYLSLSKTPLSLDLETIKKKGIKIDFLFAANDPGFDLVKDGAPKALRKGLKDNWLSVSLIENADHTFSRKAQRDEMIDKFLALVR